LGLAAGAGVLCKWGLGLFPLAVLGLDALLASTLRTSRKIKAIGTALLACGLITAPWLGWLMAVYPTETVATLYYNVTSHVLQPTDTPGSGVLYYWVTFPELYATSLQLLLPIGIGLWLWQTRGSTRWVVLGSLVAVYGFFTLAAAKMEHFPLVASPFVWLLLGCVAETGIRTIPRVIPLLSRGMVVVALLVGAGWWAVCAKPHRYPNETAAGSQCLEYQQHRTIRELAQQVAPRVAIHGLPAWTHAEAMFWCRGCLAYDSFLSVTQQDTLRRAGYQVVHIPFSSWGRQP
jgi:4-amino-4-deoxy-L-arabinose transferase-like glycosyltransferase